MPPMSSFAKALINRVGALVGQSPEEIQAVLRLNAAAPKLLVALRELSDPTWPEWHWTRQRASLSAAQDAIALAEGTRQRATESTDANVGSGTPTT